MKTSVNMPDEMILDLDSLADKRMSNRSQIIKQAIKEHLDKAREAGELDG